MRQLVPVLFLIGAAAVASAPSDVQACSYVPTPELRGYPADGAKDVATDAIPIYLVPGGGVTALPSAVASVELVGPHGSVELSTRAAEGGLLEFAPKQPLAANSKYTLSVTWAATMGSPSPGQDALSFETGAGPFVGDDRPPPTAVSHYSTQHASSCDWGPKATCISLNDDSIYQWQFVGDDHVNAALGSFFINMYGADQGHPFECMTLRRRAPNGALSQPSTACTKDGSWYDLEQFKQREGSLLPVSCKQEGLKWENKVLSKGAVSTPAAADETTDSVASNVLATEPAGENDGCNIGRGKSAPFGWLLGLATWAFARAAARRRSARARTR